MEQPIIHGYLKIGLRPIPNKCVWMSLPELPTEKVRGSENKSPQEGPWMDTQSPVLSTTHPGLRTTVQLHTGPLLVFKSLLMPRSGSKFVW